MSTDATFEDGAEKPLRLKALDGDDLQVISALVQDAIFPAEEMKWIAAERRFAILLNRFRWEDASAAEKRSRHFERVQSVLVIEDVMKVASQGVIREEGTVYSALNVEFEPSEGGAGQVVINLSGDGAVSLKVEVLEVVLKDVTRPYVAPSKSRPNHTD